MIISHSKETSGEQSENSEVMETETVEATEVPAEKAMDTVSVDSMQVKENMTETENN